MEQLHREGGPTLWGQPLYRLPQQPGLLVSDQPILWRPSIIGVDTRGIDIRHEISGRKPLMPMYVVCKVARGHEQEGLRLLDTLALLVGTGVGLLGNVLGCLR